MIVFLFSDQSAIPDLEQLDDSEWDALLENSKRHLVTPILYYRLKALSEQIDLPPRLAERLHLVYLQSTTGNIRLRSELLRALKTITKADIPCILLKGAHLSEFVYEDIGLRVMEDVDLLFRKEDLEKAQACLLANGFLGPGSRLQIDLHWYIEQYLDVDMKTIWNSAHSVQFDGIPVLVLSPEHLVVHLCVHLAFHHQFRFAGLRTLNDIRQVLKHYRSAIDWHSVIRYAKEWGTENGVYLTLLLARDLAGAMVPEDVLVRTKPENFDRSYTEWAIAQIFSDREEEDLSLSPYFWKLWQTNSLKKKCAFFMKLIFPDKEFLFQKYPVPEKTGRKFYSYLLRIQRHFSRYFVIFWRIIARDKSTLKMIREKRQTYFMMEWIAANGDRLL